MGRKLTVGKVVRTIGKISREIERERKRQEREANRRMKALERERKQEERERIRRFKENERKQKAKNREALKIQKEQEKFQAKRSTEAKKVLSMYTVEEHGLANEFRGLARLPKVNFDLKNELTYLRKQNSKLLNTNKRIKASQLDTFLFSGKFNSVLGIDGIRTLKALIYDNVSSDENILDFEDFIFQSGFFYEYEYSTEVMKELENDKSWKTFYRILLTKESISRFSEVSLQNLKKSKPKLYSNFDDVVMTNLYKGIKEFSKEFEKDYFDFINNVKNIKIAS